MDKPELIDLLEDELEILVRKAHKSGLTYWDVYRQVVCLLPPLLLKVEAERQL